MKCPECKAWTRVLSTRDGISRRRECANGHRFTTSEIVVATPGPRAQRKDTNDKRTN